MRTLELDGTKPRDVAVLGRATIDLYAAENGPLEDVSTFNKYVGGSTANTAVALANMHLDVGYIGKVSDDQFGRFIVRFLGSKGVDVSHIRYDEGGARSGVTIGEIKSPTECSFFMYREKVADLNIRCAELDEAFIRDFKALLISGTSLSHGPAREAVFLAIELARRNNVRVIFDPDFRVGTWKSREEMATYYRLAAEKADMVVGTREEFDCLELLTMPGNQDDSKSAQSLFAHGVKLVAVKHGREGSTVFASDGNTYPGVTYPAKVVKTLGAGDAYAGAFLYGLLAGKDIGRSLHLAAAAASITISGRSCAASTPTLEEVEAFLASHRPGDSRASHAGSRPAAGR
jgi:5-dehydro-2-deoxygluconokinase